MSPIALERIQDPISRHPERTKMTQHQTVRMRHEGARRRQLTVAERTFVTPHLLRLRLAGDDFEDFVSSAADDHVKLFLPGMFEPSGKPVMRDYTPRSFDPEKGELTIEFALHDDPGPATKWAMMSKVGDPVSIGGPRGSIVIPDDYDWYWLIGDETAIPAIERRIEEWPDCRISCLIAVTSKEEEVALKTAPSRSVHWVHRPANEAADPASLVNALADWKLPTGDGFVWIAAEAGVARSIRTYLLERGHPQTNMKAAGYWTAGKADTTERFD